MASRKTISVADLLERFNHQLSLPDLSRETRACICTTIETILHKSGNYSGFCYAFDFAASSEESRKLREYERFYYVHNNLLAEYATYRETRAKDPYKCRT